MPVSRKHAENAELRAIAADRMGIDVQYVFFLPKARTYRVLAVWTAGWSAEEVERCKAMKAEIKALAAQYGAKIYMSDIHPHTQEAREKERRKQRGPKYRARQATKREGQKCR